MIQESPEGTFNLKKSLSAQFCSDESQYLAGLLFCSYQVDSITYEELNIDDEVKDDIILLAYEERILLPMKSRRGSAWEDRILSFSKGERYHLPRVVQFLVGDAQASAVWNVDESIGKALVEAGESDIVRMVNYLNDLIEVSPKHEIEVGIMQMISNKLDLEMDMHDTLDRFVRCAIMSPRTQRTIHTGISWYELNPCLFWKSI